MKIVLLAGGLGSRISEESGLRPKPMVEIGGKPILWHIMKIYSHFGFNDFVICCGYKGYVIKDYFYNYYLHQSDVSIDLRNNKIVFHDSKSEPWSVTLVDTGLNTMTGGRIARVKEYIGNEPFMLTYGDGVSDINLDALLSFHKKRGKLATLTAVQPLGKFGALGLNGDNVTHFQEKPQGDGHWVNGGFFVLEPGIFDYIKNGDETIWEREPLECIARDGQLSAYKHDGYWQPMDTLKERNDLEALWIKGNAPWKKWI